MIAAFLLVQNQPRVCTYKFNISAVSAFGWLFFCPFVCNNTTSIFSLQKSKKKPLAQMTPGDLGVDINPSLTVLSVEDPPVREAGSKVEDVDQLIAKLKDSGVF